MSDGAERPSGEHLFDPVRRKPLKARPEERVRQALVRWLQAELGVPPRLIAVEYALSALDPKSRRRADVVVWMPGGGGLRPWLLAECKAPGVALADDAADQTRAYAASIRADHVLVTNGDAMRAFRLEETPAGGRYVAASGLPAFPRAG